MQPFDHDCFDGHEHISYVHDEISGLQAIIAIHSTALGPAAGGCRMLPYESTGAALYDVLRLSRGMSYKNAMAGLPLGGGKAVIIGDPAKDKTPLLLEAFGRAVEKLHGIYWTAEDMNITTDDMAVIAGTTSYAAGLETGKSASGNPSPVTARGVFEGIRTAVKHRLGASGLSGLTVAVQGVGSVGMSLCSLLHEAGARLVVSDVDQVAIKMAVETFDATAVAPEKIWSAHADVFAPCAGGAVLNRTTIPVLKASVVAGAANNQLDTSDCGTLLTERGILYAPDYVINGGGIINVASEILKISNPDWIPGRINRLIHTLDDIFNKAEAEKSPTGVVADRMARERIRAARREARLAI